MLPTVCDVSKKIGLATGTGIRRPLEIIVNSVTAYTPIDEIVYVRYNSRPQNPIWGQFRKFAQQPSAYTGEKTFVEIRYASHLSRDFYRFIVCKELCHALDSDEGTHSVTNRAVTRLINTFALWSANKPASGVGTPAVDAETYAEIGALELELPRLGGRFAGQDSLIGPSRLLSYSIGER